MEKHEGPDNSEKHEGFPAVLLMMVKSGFGNRNSSSMRYQTASVTIRLSGPLFVPVGL